ncbi:MAG: hypothetical protein AAB316_19455, partial [Bacteroidota bacterium]
PKINNFPLFWENGMKLSAEHFQHLEESIEDAVRDARALSLSASGAYGLLPMSQLLLRNTEGVTPRSVRITLESCRAIMPGGYRVEILPEIWQQLQLPLKLPAVEFMPEQNMRYHIFLIVNDKRRVPSGIPQVRPIRHPYLSPEYALECLPHSKLSAVANLSPNRLKLGEWQNGKIVEGYIPACLSIRGFPLLDTWHKFFQNQLENITRIGIQVIHEHRNRDVLRIGFCQPVVQFIRSSQSYFRWILPQQPPAVMAAYYGNLAGLVESMLETIDRDFLRNHLKDGQIHNLHAHLHELTKHHILPLEEMAIVMNRMQRFGEALQLTFNSLTSYVLPAVHSGDQKVIVSG